MEEFVLVLLLAVGGSDVPKHDKQEITYATMSECRTAGRLKVGAFPFVKGYVCLGPNEIEAMQLPE